MDQYVRINEIIKKNHASATELQMPVPTHVPAPPTDVMSWSPQGRGRAGAKVAKSLVPLGDSRWEERKWSGTNG